MTKPGLAYKNWGLFDLLPVGIVIIDKEYTVLFWNRCITEWTAIPATEIVGTRLFQRFINLDKSQYRARIDLVFSGGPAALFSSQLHPHFIPAPLQDGTLRIQNTSVIPLHEEDNLLAMIVIEDVTDLVTQVRAFREMKKIAEKDLEELTKAQKALHIANSKLNIVSSITRHDVLNQVMVISGYAHLLKEKISDNPLLKDYVQKIQNSSGIIDKFLVMTREYDQFGTKAPVWQNVASESRKAAQESLASSIMIEIDTGKLEVFADPMFEKVIYNLIKNAPIHGKKVTKIRVGFKEQEQNGVLTIEDDGVGIQNEQKQKIFEKGFGENVGLGLFLSREILTLTDISIQETGISGSGARFELLIPKAMYRLHE
jgi:signal transduction histidine kinase